jgi:glycerol dehydrogenase
MLIFGSPFRYYQGPGLIGRAGEILSPLGKKLFLIGDSIVFDIVGARLKVAFAASGADHVTALFNGECSDSEIRRLAADFQAARCDAVVGIGGGKAADTAKAVSILLDAPVAIIPTIAASDAPVSHIALIYKEDHSKDRVEYMRYSPWCILVDSEIILGSPRRLFVSGIGDAAATKFEADACIASGATNFLKGKQPKTAQAVNELCWKIVREQSQAALSAMEAGKLTQDFEDVLEATTLLSGLGFENGGLAAGHAMSSGLTMVKSALKSTHGELVAFGLLVQFVLEQRAVAFMNDIITFFKAVGLPTTLAQLGVGASDRGDVRAMVNKICTPPNIVFNMPCTITPTILEEAIYRADALGA